ncbi:MAG TPA: hypothetical protein VGC61_02865 [Pyrinomonadaceae bacterium]|jgi:hypothetical protein
MGNRKHNKNEIRALPKILAAHYHALVEAGSDESILRQYEALLRFLRSKPQLLEGLLHAKHRTDRHKALPSLNEDELRRASLDDIDKLVSDEATARKDLEYIAIQRFSVPRGSMRSFSNKQMLVDKLRTLIANERTHETIGVVARGQARRMFD